jgi:two-component sensor histidine kinase
LPWAGDAAPYALVFAAVVGAAVLAGWRSGLIALLVGQAMVWYFVMPPRWSFRIEDPSIAVALVVATLAQSLILVIISLYQLEVERASTRLTSERDLLQKALREIDHRTSNNYQTVLAMVLAQANSAADAPVKDALHQVADRIRAIASASRKLAVASESLEQVRIAEHLQDLCDEIEKGLSRRGIDIECSFDDLMLSADATVCLSILVNELVTNALKHAFPGKRQGTIRVALSQAPGGLELRVEDNGAGMAAGAASTGTGLGRRLVDTFVKQLRGRHEVTSGAGGTRHSIRIPR